MVTVMTRSKRETKEAGFKLLRPVGGLNSHDIYVVARSPSVKTKKIAFHAIVPNIRDHSHPNVPTNSSKPLM